MPIIRKSRLINKLQFAVTYVHSILITKSDTRDFYIYDRAHQSLLLKIFLLHNTRELNYFKSNERPENNCAAWPYLQARGFNQEEYCSCSRFQGDAEMPSKSFGFVESLAKFNLIKNL